MTSNSSMRVVSGIQPTGDLHLGNLLGAILRWVRMQDEAQCLFFLADLHALTVDVDPAKLQANVREMAAALIASGIDPAKSTLFAQSAVPAHPELAWILNCTARMGWLNRMTQFKEKSGKSREGASVGLFSYPVLQAADVLLYQATHVPVGEDQKQHLELARDIAQKFNNDFRGEIEAKGYADGVFFQQPEPVITGPATRVMSLRDGTKKMSKSEPSDMSRINLMDDTDAIADKIKRAKTDMLPAPPANLEELAARPEIDNLVGIYAALAGITKEEALKALIATSSEGPSIFTGFKRTLTEVVTARLGPIRAEIVRLIGDPAEIDRVLADGARRAREIATPIMNEVKDIVGFIRS
jgi:tryptophanyl-tRNA synthetase